jgi:hypothetical protein
MRAARNLITTVSVHRALNDAYLCWTSQDLTPIIGISCKSRTAVSRASVVKLEAMVKDKLVYATQYMRNCDCLLLKYLNISRKLPRTVYTWPAIDTDIGKAWAFGSLCYIQYSSSEGHVFTVSNYV